MEGVFLFTSCQRQAHQKGSAQQLMADESTAPAEQTSEPQTTTEPVRDAEAVLKQNAELLAEVKKLKTLTKEADGFDFQKARAAIEAQEKAELDRLTKKGEWDKLKEQLDTRHATELQKAKDDFEGLLGNLKREKLTNALVEKGALPDRAKYLVHELDAQIELDAKEFTLKKIGGIGDATEFDLLVESVRKASPFFFASQTQPGGSASGSGSNSGSSANTMPKAQWDAMNVKEQAAYIKSGGKPVA